MAIVFQKTGGCCRPGPTRACALPEGGWVQPGLDPRRPAWAGQMIDAGFQEVVMNLRLNFKFPLKSCCNAAEGWRHGAETFLKQPETSASLPAHVPSLAPGLVPAPFLAGDSPHPHSSPLKRGKPFPWPKASSCTARAGRHGALGAPAGAQARRRTCHASAGTSAGASTRTSTRTSAGRCRGRLMFLNRVKLFRKCFSSVSALLLSPSWDAAPGRAACGCRLAGQADEGWRGPQIRAKAV